MDEKVKKCSCGCGGKSSGKMRSFTVSSGEDEMMLPELPLGSTAKIVRILPGARGRKKLADIGIVPGMDVVMEAHAPFGGLLRIKVMETSMSVHSDDVKGVVVKCNEEE